MRGSGLATWISCITQLRIIVFNNYAVIPQSVVLSLGSIRCVHELVVIHSFILRAILFYSFIILFTKHDDFSDF